MFTSILAVAHVPFPFWTSCFLVFNLSRWRVVIFYTKLSRRKAKNKKIGSSASITQVYEVSAKKISPVVPCAWSVRSPRRFCRHLSLPSTIQPWKLRQPGVLFISLLERCSMSTILLFFETISWLLSYLQDGGVVEMNLNGTPYPNSEDQRDSGRGKGNQPAVWANQETNHCICTKIPNAISLEGKV